MRAEGFDQSALARAIPELGVADAQRLSLPRAILPDFATGAALVLLACSGPAYVSLLALGAMIATAAYRAKSLAGSQ